jgi:dolichol kinase
MARTVRSPDGRTWQIERVRPDSAVQASRQEPAFWASVVVTVILIAFIIWMIAGGHILITIISVILFVIWLLERGLNVIRPNIRAHTDGPPNETFTWRTTHRYGYDKIEARIAEQIEAGRAEGEPPGAVLVGI